MIGFRLYSPFLVKLGKKGLLLMLFISCAWHLVAAVAMDSGERKEINREILRDNLICFISVYFGGSWGGGGGSLGKFR